MSKNNVKVYLGRCFLQFNLFNKNKIFVCITNMYMYWFYASAFVIYITFSIFNETLSIYSTQDKYLTWIKSTPFIYKI